MCGNRFHVLTPGNLWLNPNHCVKIWQIIPMSEWCRFLQGWFTLCISDSCLSPVLGLFKLGKSWCLLGDWPGSGGPSILNAVFRFCHANQTPGWALPSSCWASCPEAPEGLSLSILTGPPASFSAASAALRRDQQMSGGKRMAPGTVPCSVFLSLILFPPMWFYW